MEKINIVPKGHNKSVYFLLPLLSLNRFSFGGGDNFYNCYVSYNGKIVAVVADKTLAGEYWTHPNYVTDFDVDIEDNKPATAIVYNIPEQFEKDLDKFLDGKYSEMGDPAKDVIYQLSTLTYRSKIPGTTAVNTHKLLLVLTKEKALRAWLETQTGSEIRPDQELLEKPHYGEEFMDIDTTPTS